MVWIGRTITTHNPELQFSFSTPCAKMSAGDSKHKSRGPSNNKRMSPPRLTCSLRDRSKSSLSIRRSGNHYGYGSLRKNLSCDPLKDHGQSLLQPMDGSQPSNLAFEVLINRNEPPAFRNTVFCSNRTLYVNGVRLLIRRFVSAVELELEETGGHSAEVTLPSVLHDRVLVPAMRQY